MPVPDTLVPGTVVDAVCNVVWNVDVSPTSSDIQTKTVFSVCFASSTHFTPLSVLGILFSS